MVGKGKRDIWRAASLWAVLVLAGQVWGADGPAAYERLRRDQLMWFVDGDGFVRPVQSGEDWAVRRGQILEGMQAVMGKLPGEERRVALDVKTESEEEIEGIVRRKVSFAVEPGDRISAYLMWPKGLKGRAAGVLCLHQTIAVGKGSPAGLSDKKELHYALELARRGFVTLSPDYPYFGDSKGADPYKQGYVSGTMKGVWNHMRCVDLLHSLETVDGGRIGALGHSLGGHNALFVSAFDTRIKAVVSNCGFNSFTKYYGGNLTGWSSEKYMPRIASVYGKDPKKMPFDFGEVLGAIAPRAVLAIGPVKDSNFEVSGVRDCLGAASPVFRLLGAEWKLLAEYPDCGHEFPAGMRERAYGFLEGELKG
jgi:dienelactone hydrolase